MEVPCNTNLTLGFGGAAKWRLAGGETPPVHFHHLFPTRPKGEAVGDVVEEEKEDQVTASLTYEEKGATKLYPRKAEEEAVDKGGPNESGARKKLRLTKEQSTLLENSFRERNTLTHVQKQEIADRLNLRPRQVEVWFQNRRARTKLKQTEVDCEFLKKYCESLSDENRRLRKELQELRSMKVLPKAAALTVCPSCQRIAAGEGARAVGPAR
ncbi:unnamed protein product [Spirodela intermedia]|uniref:Homeobox domain-containing protein n=1 Tax=Spirodela intermedia TaxID=51605 RepID=A0A7I8IWH2_SPIIN|nr:unnamed protein product [Spirodela intermedia]CAA6662328.1 unnamed protein product [Spirodela intermedia]